MTLNPTQRALNAAAAVGTTGKVRKAVMKYLREYITDDKNVDKAGFESKLKHLGYNRAQAAREGLEGVANKYTDVQLLWDALEEADRTPIRTAKENDLESCVAELEGQLEEANKKQTELLEAQEALKGTIKRLLSHIPSYVKAPRKLTKTSSVSNITAPPLHEEARRVTVSRRVSNSEGQSKIVAEDPCL